MHEPLDPQSGSKSPHRAHGHAASQAEFTLRDVSAAISKQLQLPPELHEVGDLAGKLHGFVNGNAQFHASGLDGASFRSLLLNNLSSEIAQLLDPAQAAKIRTEQQRNANITSAQAPGLGDGPMRLVNGVMVRGDNGAVSRDSAVTNPPSSYALQAMAEMDRMRAYAREQGVSWAANNPDILKLGRPAIDILAQTHLRKDVYDGLTKTGLSPKGSVGVAAMIHAKGGDANEGGKIVTDSLNTMNDKAVTDAVNARATLQVPDKNETPQQKQAREAKIPDADQQVESAVGEHIKHRPEHAATGKKMMKTLGVKMKENDAQAKATVDKSAKADNKAAQKNDALSAFNSLESKPEAAAQPKEREASNKSTQTEADKPKPQQVVASSKPKQAAPT